MRIDVSFIERLLGHISMFAKGQNEESRVQTYLHNLGDKWSRVVVQVRRKLHRDKSLHPECRWSREL
jgi:hypothetical protein